MGNNCAEIVNERKEKKMSRKMKITGIATIALILLAGTAIAQGPGGWGRPDGGPRMGAAEMGPGGQGGFGMENLARFRMMFRHIDLTDEQIDDIRSITETAREETRNIMETAGRPEDHASFIEIFTSSVLTVSDLEEAADKRDEVKEAMQDVIFQAIVDVHDVLTVEQLDKLADMDEEHGGEMGYGSEMGRRSMR